MAKKNPDVTEFGEKLNSSLNNVENFIWIEQDGTKKKMIDMTYDALQSAYFHVCDMLWNNIKFSPGKYIVKENIKRTIEDCNAELLLRYLLYDLNIDCLKTNQNIVTYIMNMKHSENVTDDDSVATIFNGLPAIYSTVTIGKLMAACFDKLDVINRKLISDKFILAQGIWLTQDEKNDLLEYDDNGKQRSFAEIIIERLFLKNVKLKIDPKGLSYAEFRALVNLTPFAKISSLPTFTLQLLRDKILLLLINDVDYHINKWTDIKTNIEKVAEYKHFMLKEKKY